MKLIYLYKNCIITKEDFIEMIKDTLNSMEPSAELLKKAVNLIDYMDVSSSVRSRR